MVRPAFTMIELIFALVIMGIVFISLPLILINNSKSLEDNLIQESIFLTSSKITHIMGLQWDNNSSEFGVGTLAASDVVDVVAGAAALNRSFSEFRVGHFQENKHRRMTPAGTPRSATAVGGDADDAGVFDDVDDFHGQTAAALVAGADTTTEFGYKKAYRTDINVTYVNDGAGGTFFNGNPVQNFAFTTATAGGTTNLKMIDVSVEQNNSSTGTWDTTLRLRAYVANIGETDYHKRRY